METFAKDGYEALSIEYEKSNAEKIRRARSYRKRRAIKEIIKKVISVL